MGTPDNEVYIIKDKDEIDHVKGAKKIIAEKIITSLSKVFK
jgi:hypothetical protein